MTTAGLHGTQDSGLLLSHRSLSKFYLGWKYPMKDLSELWALSSFKRKDAIPASFTGQFQKPVRKIQFLSLINNKGMLEKEVPGHPTQPTYPAPRES